MRLRSTLFCFGCVALLPGLLFFGPARKNALAAATGLGSFPSVEANSLNKQRYLLPQDFGGQVNLVLISFAREQQTAVDSWLPAARQAEQQYADLRYYELPTTSKENLLYRWWFNSALRSNNADPALNGRILTLYVSKRHFLHTLDIPNEKQIAVLLVDRSGQVLWKTAGAYTASKAASMASALPAATAPASTVQAAPVSASATTSVSAPAATPKPAAPAAGAK
jgi:hypothetical protein